jgi:hypothetical protein
MVLTLTRRLITSAMTANLLCGAAAARTGQAVYVFALSKQH